MATTGTFGFPTPDDSARVRDGAEAIRALGDAVDAQFAGGFQFAGQRIYESDGTFAKDDPLGTGDIGLRAIRVRMVGGGGGGSGGSGATQVGGSGGGGGGYLEVFLTDLSVLAASETVTRGAGGAGSSGGTSNAGGQSSFGTLMTAGGGGGTSTGGFTGAGGSAGTSSVGVGTGSAGGAGSAGGKGTSNQTGSGGNSAFGGGASGIGAGDFNNAGANASPDGGGGGGARVFDTEQFGGSGAAGIVIVEVFA